MNDLVPHRFEGSLFRSIERDGETWFVAGDAAAILGYGAAKDLTRTLDDDEKGGHSVPTLWGEKGLHTVDTAGGPQQVAIISEAGLYRAILQRRATRVVTPVVRDRITRFQRWVFHDVLPAIRRTGGYGPGPDLSDPDLLQRLLLQHLAARRAAEDRADRAEAELARNRVAPRRLESNAGRIARAAAAVRGFLAQAARPVTRSELYRRVDGSLDARQLDGVMRELIDSGTVEAVVERTPGRPRTSYRTVPGPG